MFFVLSWLNYNILQVLWLGQEECKVTWEPKEKVPPSLIEEFKAGAVMVAAETSATSGIGQTMHTLSVVKHLPTHQPSSSAHSRPVISDSEG